MLDHAAEACSALLLHAPHRPSSVSGVYDQSCIIIKRHDVYMVIAHYQHHQAGFFNNLS
jgi:ribosomal protein L36